MKRRNNDILWKVMLEEVFDDLLRFCWTVADEEFDLPRGFEFLDKEFAELYPEASENSDIRFVDKLVKTFTRSGAEEWILIHVEVQGQQDPEFPRRMFRYFNRIYDRYDKPLTAIALFTGKVGPRAIPPIYQYRFAGTTLIYQYNTIYLCNLREEELAASNNPFALVLLIAKQALLQGKTSDEELLKIKLSLARALFRKGFPRRKVSAIFTFLKNYLRFADTDYNHTFTQQLNHVTQKTVHMNLDEYVQQVLVPEAREEGMEEGIKLGLEKGARPFVDYLLKNTKFSGKKIAALAGVTPEFVEEVRKGSRGPVVSG